MGVIGSVVEFVIFSVLVNLIVNLNIKEMGFFLYLNLGFNFFLGLLLINEILYIGCCVWNYYFFELGFIRYFVFDKVYMFR